ncbi:hypothetical protein Q4I32_004802 [Leishmania shawi]|uniref:Uncharacterized protein n=1 Tax=Leishmania shawi TaxID=5680 RepID=A0AAW3BQE5_9TRYP
MGSRTSRTLSSDSISPAGAPANAASLLCCSTASDVTSKRGEQAELTDLRRQAQRTHEADEENFLPCLSAARRAQQSNGKYYSNARKRQLNQYKTSRDCQSDRVVAPVQQPNLRQPQKDASEASASSVRTMAHQPPLRRRSVDHHNMPLDHEQRSRPGTRAQRRRKCWTDSPYTGQGSGRHQRASPDYLPFLAINTPLASQGDGGGGAGFFIG